MQHRYLSGYNIFAAKNELSDTDKTVLKILLGNKDPELVGAVPTVVTEEQL